MPSLVPYSGSLVSLLVVVVFTTMKRSSTESYRVDKYSLLMPNVRPKKECKCHHQVNIRGDTCIQTHANQDLMSVLWYAGYRMKNSNGVQKWDLLGKRDPTTPQMFYPIENNITVESGDILAARCTMESRRNTYTRIGTTSDDEMCNFYLMYWVEGTEPLEQHVCLSEGSPHYYWYRDPNLTNIPDEEV